MRPSAWAPDATGRGRGLPPFPRAAARARVPGGGARGGRRATAPGPAPPPHEIIPADGPPGLVNLAWVSSTLHCKVDKPGERHSLAAGVTSLAKLSLTLRHGQLPLKCASIQAGEIFTAGGSQPVTQLDNLPGGDCQITITGQGGSGGASTGEVAVITFTASARGSDMLNAVSMEAYDGKGRAVPLSATSMQIVVD